MLLDFNEKLNQGQLHKLLHQLGYENIKATSEYLIYIHPKNEKALIILKHARKNEIIQPYNLAYVFTNIVNGKVASVEELGQLIDNIKQGIG